MNETVLTILFVLGVTVFFSWLSYRQKQSSWSGTLVKKYVDENEDSGVTLHYLIFDTDKGKKKVNLSSAAAEYQKWNIGDKGVKTKGNYFPEKQ